MGPANPPAPLSTVSNRNSDDPFGPPPHICPVERLPNQGSDNANEISPCILEWALSQRPCSRNTTSAVGAPEHTTTSNSDPATKTPTRILLQGPRRSGRTSISMDLAVSVASSAPCRCGRNTPETCRCVAVTILVASPQETTVFPLPCEQYPSAASKETIDFQDRIKQLEQSYFLMDDACDYGDEHNSSLWSKYALRRIQVVHLASMRDCLQFLLSIQGKMAHEQSLGAIIVDDLDILTGTTNNNLLEPGPSHLPSDNASHLLRATQLFAILTDTAETVARLHHCAPPILMATMETKGSLPDDAFLTSFFTSLVSIRTHQAARVNWQRTFARAGGDDDEEGIVSSWIAEMTLTHQAGNKKLLHYMITSKFDEEFRILWKNS